MAALNDPNFQTTAGKVIDEVYDPEDDKALMRLLNKIKEKGEAKLEDKLEIMGNNGYISLTQFNGLLNAHDTAQTDYIRLHRVTRFFYMKSDQVKKQKV